MSINICGVWFWFCNPPHAVSEGSLSLKQNASQTKVAAAGQPHYIKHLCLYLIEQTKDAFASLVLINKQFSLLKLVAGLSTYHLLFCGVWINKGAEQTLGMFLGSLPLLHV